MQKSNEKDEDFLAFEEKAHYNIIALYTQKRRFSSLFEGVNNIFNSLQGNLESTPYSKPNYMSIFFIGKCHEKGFSICKYFYRIK
jgi:hypothetical protein